MDFARVYQKAVYRRDTLKADLAEAEQEVSHLARVADRYGITLNPAASPAEHEVQSATQGRGSLIVYSGEQEHGLHGMVDKVLQTWFRGESVTKTDVALRLAIMFPGKEIKGPSLSADLWNRAKDGELNVVEKGVGNKPNVYQIPLVKGVYNPYAGLALGTNEETKSLPGADENGEEGASTHSSPESAGLGTTS